MNEPTIGLGIRITRSDDRRLDTLAKRTGRSKSAVLRVLIRIADCADGANLRLLRDALKVEDVYEWS